MRCFLQIPLYIVVVYFDYRLNAGVKNPDLYRVAAVLKLVFIGRPEIHGRVMPFKIIRIANWKRSVDRIGRHIPCPYPEIQNSAGGKGNMPLDRVGTQPVPDAAQVGVGVINLILRKV